MELFLGINKLLLQNPGLIRSNIRTCPFCVSAQQTEADTQIFTKRASLPPPVKMRDAIAGTDNRSFAYRLNLGIDRLSRILLELSIAEISTVFRNVQDEG